MKIELAYKIIQIVYRQVLREIITDYVVSTESQVDDFLLNLLDNLLQYGGD